MLTTLTAVLDACVLFPAPLRDLLMELAVRDLFRARWTDEIHDEWVRNLLGQRPDLDPKRLERTRSLMNSHVRDCLVTGYQTLIPALTLPDSDDRHVLAAAIRCDADLIITKNLKDFPREILDGFGIEAQHPDDFIVDLLHTNEGSVSSAVRAVLDRLKNPPKTYAEYLLTLEQQELIQTVRRLRDLADLV